MLLKLVFWPHWETSKEDPKLNSGQKNSLTDRFGRTTYCSLMQREIFLEGQQSVEFFFFYRCGPNSNEARKKQLPKKKKNIWGQHNKKKLKKQKSWGRRLFNLMKPNLKSALKKRISASDGRQAQAITHIFSTFSLFSTWKRKQTSTHIRTDLFFYNTLPDSEFPYKRRVQIWQPPQ